MTERENARISWVSICLCEAQKFLGIRKWLNFHESVYQYSRF